jgi:hypothetical protein
MTPQLLLRKVKQPHLLLLILGPLVGFGIVLPELHEHRPCVPRCILARRAEQGCPGSILRCGCRHDFHQHSRCSADHGRVVRLEARLDNARMQRVGRDADWGIPVVDPCGSQDLSHLAMSITTTAACQ